MSEHIISLNLEDFKNGTAETKQKFVSELGEAYEKIGFVVITYI